MSTTLQEPETAGQPNGIVLTVYYVIEIDAVNGPCFVCEDVEGDPGRTNRIGLADRFATRNEATEDMNAIRRRYPNRNCKIRQVPVT